MRLPPTFREATTGLHWETTSTQIRVVLLIGWSKFSSRQDQSEAYPDLGSDVSSVWNSCSRSADAISRRSQCWRRKMWAFFLRLCSPLPFWKELSLTVWHCAMLSCSIFKKRDLKDTPYTTTARFKTFKGPILKYCCRKTADFKLIYQFPF